MTSRGKDKYDHKVFNCTVDARVQESKTETFKKKFPLRVQNDWSEHISSKGLIYYYNCRTEVSQWQKPDEWTLSSMPQEDIKKLLNSKPRNGENNNNKRNHPNQITSDTNTSPKRIKYNNNNQPIPSEKQCNFNNSTLIKNQKIEQVKNAKSINSISNTFSGINKCKTSEANFNNDDMDISPGSSPLSRGSHSPDCENKKHGYFEFETPTYRNQSNSKPTKVYNKSWNLEQKGDHSSPANHESNSGQAKIFQNQSVSKVVNSNLKYQDSSTNSTSLSQFQISLATSLRSTLNILQPRSQFVSKDDVSNSKLDNCLSVYHISDILFRLEAVNNNGETANSYRSHRLQAQLSQSSNSFSYSNNNNDSKSITKSPANINQIKELVKCLQDFIQENYPNTLSSITPVSPNYSKSNRSGYYLQILTSLMETCLMQLCPQSFNSPSSTSSPGSLKDNNSSVSTSGASQSYIETASKPDLDSPTKKEQVEIEKPKSILQDIDMVKYVSSDVTNSYRNQLADYYVQEAQVEYYKFVRLHSVLYAELACESKKLKALVRISEINTELLRQKKEDLEKLVQMLESRRLPNHLKCDYVPNS